MNQINISKWVKKDLWTIWEGIFLLLGKEPNLSSFFMCQNNEVLRSELPIIFYELAEIVKSAIHLKLLKIHRRAPNFFFNQINPIIFLEWSQTKIILNEQLNTILLQRNEIKEESKFNKNNSLSPTKNNDQNKPKSIRSPRAWHKKVKAIFEQDKSKKNQEVWKLLSTIADNGDDVIIDVKRWSDTEAHFVWKAPSTKKEIKIAKKTFQSFMSTLKK